jgi:hypothetical protein
VPDKYKSEIIFTPTRSMLLPNEEAKVVATFTPLKKKEYSVTVPLFARNQFDNVKNFVGFYNPGSGLSLQGGASAPGSMGGVHTIRKELSICGAGSDGLIGISPCSLDFGTITVGFSKTLQVLITNKSNCNLYIELKMIPLGTQGMDQEQAHKIS